MNSPVFIDERWVGDHGIGRVARSLKTRLDFNDLALSGSPSSPLDSIRFFLRTLQLPCGSIVFSPGYNAPLFFIRPFIFIVHDLNHIDYVENSSLLKRLYYSFVLKRACRSAARVLTVSEFSKLRISQWSGINFERIVNISNGVDKKFCPDGERFSPGFNYLLSVSNRKPHKNEIGILRSFARSKIDKSIRLLFTGSPTDEVEEATLSLGIKDRVQFLGRVSEGDLPKLYRGGLALIFPSLYEGFGLPVIESMACGTPVLTSTISSLPEVSGGAALLVDPKSVDEIAGGIERIATDGGLRARLRESGLRRAKDFNWDLVAERVRDVLNEIQVELRE